MTDRPTYVKAPEGLAPGTGYSHVVWGTGRFVAVSGQCAFDERREVVGVGDPLAQSRRVFENIRRALAAAGATFDDIVKLTYFVTDIDHLAQVRTARDEVLDPERLPASSAVQVSALILPELLVEIEAYALLPEEGPRGG
ncbi:RidA family protein [Streptomyces yaizuensis]|uniref:RidA family protein n=1 Tax=Streptomyces yaizuensis TaxID=2989713 RepID=A0ABQ5PB63_9ACTN|nr:RidA family protein [Streptomyces sp. YSPA8]GLF99838.1 RidA family protein [Streptomyces sp. YSPA8]